MSDGTYRSSRPHRMRLRVNWLKMLAGVGIAIWWVWAWSCALAPWSLHELPFGSAVFCAVGLGASTGAFMGVAPHLVKAAWPRIRAAWREPLVRRETVPLREVEWPPPPPDPPVNYPPNPGTQYASDDGT